WCDLVEFVGGWRITRVLAHTVTAVPSRAAGARATFAAAGGDAVGGDAAPPAPPERRPVTTEDVALVLFETDAGAAGSVVVSQVAAGRKTRLWFSLDGTSAAVVFDQEQPETLWVGRRAGAEVVTREAGALSPEAERLAVLPAGH